MYKLLLLVAVKSVSVIKVNSVLPGETVQPCRGDFKKQVNKIFLLGNGSLMISLCTYRPSCGRIQLLQHEFGLNEVMGLINFLCHLSLFHGHEGLEVETAALQLYRQE